MPSWASSPTLCVRTSWTRPGESLHPFCTRLTGVRSLWRCTPTARVDPSSWPSLWPSLDLSADRRHTRGLRPRKRRRRPALRLRQLQATPSCKKTTEERAEEQRGDGPLLLPKHTILYI